FIDLSDPIDLNFDANSMVGEVEKFQAAQLIPTSDALPLLPIYCVITPPEVRPSDAILPNNRQDAGYNTLRTSIFGTNGSDLPLVWAGEFKNFNLSGTTNKLDNYISILSHEMAEAITCIGNDGIVVLYQFPGSDQISDNEAQNYTYRVGGNLVQSYWSQQSL